MRYLVACLAGASLLLLNGCINFSGENTPKETKIGIILPMSGGTRFQRKKDP